MMVPKIRSSCAYNRKGPRDSRVKAMSSPAVGGEALALIPGIQTLITITAITCLKVKMTLLSRTALRFCPTAVCVELASSTCIIIGSKLFL